MLPSKILSQIWWRNQNLSRQAKVTKFHNFVDELTRIEVEYTFRFMETVGYESVKDGTITEEFLHIVTTAFMEGLFEVVRHNMSREDAEKYIAFLGKYHRAGFDTFFREHEKK